MAVGILKNYGACGLDVGRNAGLSFASAVRKAVSSSPAAEVSMSTKYGNTMFRKVTEYVRASMEIRPRLVVLAPEFVGFVWLLVLIDAKQNQPVLSNSVVEFFEGRK